MELEEGLGEGEIEYSITARKLIHWFDKCLGVYEQPAGRGDCGLYPQSKHIGCEAGGWVGEGGRRRPRDFKEPFVLNKYQREKGGIS